jgi:hypothetical protein
MKPAKRDQFDTWVIDSATTLFEFARNKAIILLGGTSFGKPLSQTQAQAIATGMVNTKKQDFGAERSLVEQFVRMVKESDKHIVLLMHEKEIYTQEGMLLEIAPLLVGQSVSVIRAMFDNIWSLRVVGAGSTTKRVLVTEPDGIRLAKSRIGMGSVDNPDFDLIQKKLHDLTANQSANVQPGVPPVTTAPALVRS